MSPVGAIFVPFPPKRRATLQKKVEEATGRRGERCWRVPLPGTPSTESAEDSANVLGTTGRRGARGAPPEQEPREASLDLGFPSPQHHLPETSRDIIGPVDSTRRGALVRDVSPTEESAERATDSASV